MRQVFIENADFPRTHPDFFVSPVVNGKVLVIRLWNTDLIHFNPPIKHNNPDGTKTRVYNYDGNIVLG